MSTISTTTTTTAAAGNGITTSAKNFSTGLPKWNPDVIVIGSGMSGLTTAAILAGRGKKVMVLEQHDTPGGCCHSFKQGTEWVSAGWHYVGKPVGPMRILWEYITSGQKFTCNKKEVVDTNYGIGHFTGENTAEVMGFDIKHLRRLNGHVTWLIMVKMLPAPLAAIAWGLYKVFGKHKEAQTNWGTWCKSMTGMNAADAEKDIWWTQRGDHGVSREKTTALLSALVMYHYRHGIMHPEGGVRDTMLRVVSKVQQGGNGVVLLKAPVTQIIIDPKTNKVTGVEVGVDGAEVGAGVLVQCPLVVVTNAEVTKKLTGAQCPPEIRAAVDHFGPSMSHGAVFLTYTGKTPADLGLPTGNVWVKEQYFISAKTSSTGTVVYILWEMDYVPRGAEYEEKKEDVTVFGYNFACEMYPLLKGYDEMDSATPATTEFYLRTENGNSYGMAMPPERTGDYRWVRALRPQTSVTGLWLTGMDILCPGIMSAFGAGFMTAQAIAYPGLRGLWGNVVKDIYNQQKKISKK